jgi:predicted RNA binding protein YcfA (HicA-like mRNA interferase family)
VGRLATIQALRMIKALARLGWSVARVSGSHHILTKSGHSPVTIPVKKGATLKEGTARSILKKAGISEDEFFDVY